MSVLAMKRFTITNSLIDHVSDVEMDAESFCTPGSSNGLCTNTMSDGVAVMTWGITWGY
jgi:hypothetical protein